MLSVLIKPYILLQQNRYLFLSCHPPCFYLYHSSQGKINLKKKKKNQRNLNQLISSLLQKSPDKNNIYSNRSHNSFHQAVANTFITETMYAKGWKLLQICTFHTAYMHKHSVCYVCSEIFSEKKRSKATFTIRLSI